ncbi:DUF882 domain-containing protein [Microvirga sp. TS319]|uniref:DUF882 domain-containing protein n=1 Tax=Microvirga sp. TS319 TaxID=3241165 RepID=UPI003519EACD
MKVLRSDGMVRRTCIGLAAFLAVMVGGVRGTQDAIANGDTRTLTFYHNNTKETLTVTFRRNGQYDSAALQQLNWFLRDWRRDEATRMDPRLFDTVWEVYREVGSSAPVRVNSAYRSPQTNAMLRRRSSVVAKNSQHMQGKALDFYLPDIPADRLRAVGMKLQRGGVGYYPNAYTPFVHLDVGSVRAWPRMTRDQLVRIFPDGKTVHIPTDGRPLPGYDLARAEVLAGGGTVAGYSTYADAEEAIAAQQPRRKSFWATLFGLGDDEAEDVEEIRTASRPSSTLMASRSAPGNYYADDRNSSPIAALRQYEDRNAPVARQAPVAVAQARPEPPAAPAVVAAMAPALREDLSPPAAAPLPPTRISGLPSTVQTESGPTLAWQQGPGVQSDMSIAKGMAFAPMPPRRPDADTAAADDVAETTALAYAPLPPARPGSLAATNPIPVLSELRGPAGTTVASSAPLPPPRPERAIVVASASPVDIPVTGSTPKTPVKAPQKDTKASQVPASAVALPEVKAPAAKKPQKPATALSALMSAEPSVAMGFSNKPIGDLATNKFTGPAVKPLPVVR